MKTTFKNYCLIVLLLASSHANCVPKIDKAAAEQFIKKLDAEYTTLCSFPQITEPVVFPTHEQIEQELYNLKLTGFRRLLNEGDEWRLKRVIQAEALVDYSGSELECALNPQDTPLLWRFFEGLAKKFGSNNFQHIGIVFDPLKKMVGPIAYLQNDDEDQTKLGKLHIPHLFLTEQESASAYFENIVRGMVIDKKLATTFKALDIAPAILHGASALMALSLCQEPLALKQIETSSLAWEILQEKISVNKYLNNSGERNRLLSQIVAEIETNTVDPASLESYNGVLFPCLADRDYLQQSLEAHKSMIKLLDAIATSADKKAVVMAEIISELKNCVPDLAVQTHQ
jgi:hypothetical protein